MDGDEKTAGLEDPQAGMEMELEAGKNWVYKYERVRKHGPWLPKSLFVAQLWILFD